MTIVCRKGTTHCCGVAEFQGMNDSRFTPETAVACIYRALIVKYTPSSRPRITASQVLMVEKFMPSLWRAFVDGSTPPKLYALEDYIEENNLGVLTIGEAVPNPNSSNKLMPAWFAINKAGFIKWGKNNYYKTDYGKRNNAQYPERPAGLSIPTGVW